MTDRMGHAIDHPVVAVRSLDIASKQFARLGFSVSPRMFHTVGTANHVMMFQRSFIELLGNFEVAARNSAAIFEPLQAMVQAREGIAYLGVRSNDVAAEFDVLQAAGLSPTAVSLVERPVPLPNGGEGFAKASVTVAVRPEHPAMTLFFAQVHRPEYVWIPEWQAHPNGATDIASVVYVAEEPIQHTDYARRVLRADPASLGIEILTPAAVAERFRGLALSAKDLRKPHAVAVRVKVRSAEMCRDVLLAAGVSVVITPDRILQIRPEDACGVVIELVEEGR